MTVVAETFYITGGTLSASASSYVARQADTDLFAALSASEFCYVLNSRQMGKSSLMVRTAEKLKAEAVTVAVLDLTAIGQNLSPEQWYDGLLLSLSQQLRLEDELEDFWLQNPQLGPLQRFFESVKQIVLPAVTRLVLFVDEIDVVRSLPFSADEFFAAIRQCYIGRATDANLNRLTFCLLGTATPADLIEDTRTSPFNIGRRIELRDFTEEEAAPLAQGLGSQGSRLLQRVLYWTNGHPYLTQRLCRVAMESKATTAGKIDKLCTELFLTHQAKETEDNLMFVRNRLLKSEVDLAALLDLYRLMRSGQRVADDETNPLTSVLKLSGVARVENGTLAVRNRIYGKVFDKAWVAVHLPDAEIRRQKAAYRQGVLRTTLLGLIVMSVFFFLVAVGFHARTRYVEAVYSALKTADINARMGLKSAEEANANLYFANINLMQVAYQSHNFRKINELLEATRDYPKRGLEWDYWNRLAHLYRYRIPKIGQPFLIAPDGKSIFTNDHSKEKEPGTGIFWDAETGRKLVQLEGEGFAYRLGAFSPDGKTLVTTGVDDTVLRFWDTQTGRKTRTIKSPFSQIHWVHFVHDGNKLLLDTRMDRKADFYILDLKTEQWKLLRGVAENSRGAAALSPVDKTLLVPKHHALIVYDCETGQEIRSLPVEGLLVVAFAPDGKHFALSAQNRPVTVYDAATLTPVFVSGTMQKTNHGFAWSGDSRCLALRANSYTVDVWDTQTGRLVRTLHGFPDVLMAIGLSHNGTRLFSVHHNDILQARDIRENPESQTLPKRAGSTGHTMQLSADGSRLLFAGQTEKALLLDAQTGQMVRTFALPKSEMTDAIFSPDNGRIATVSYFGSTQSWTICLWDTKTGQILHRMQPQNHTRLTDLAFSPDGKSLYVLHLDLNIAEWETETGNLRRTLHPSNPKEWWTHTLALLHDSSRITATHNDGLLFWDVKTGQPLPPLAAGTGEVTKQAFSPDGKFLVVCNVSGEIYLFDALAQQPLWQKQGHEEPINDCLLTRDGKRFFTVGGDHCVKVWDTETGRELLTLKDFPDAVHAIALSPDEKRLYTVTSEGTIRIFFFGSEKAGY